MSEQPISIEIGARRALRVVSRSGRVIITAVSPCALSAPWKNSAPSS
ncbi:MAG: hypothetical protein ACR2HN_06205 [Tepidiformaceae bacterium]